MTATRLEQHASVRQPGRRRFVMATGAWLTFAWPHLAQCHGIGIVDPPVAVPVGISVLRNDGVRLPLREIVRRRRTLLQLMFTGCSETCPLQGALFAALQEKTDASVNRTIRLLSLSIDPMDDARSLSAWLNRFGAHQGWVAAVPSAAGIDACRTSLQSGGPSLRNHSSQVYFLDESGCLVWRSEDFPSTESVLTIARHIRWMT